MALALARRIAVAFGASEPAVAQWNPRRVLDTPRPDIFEQKKITGFTLQPEGMGEAYVSLEGYQGSKAEMSIGLYYNAASNGWGFGFAPCMFEEKGVHPLEELSHRTLRRIKVEIERHLSGNPRTTPGILSDPRAHQLASNALQAIRRLLPEDAPKDVLERRGISEMQGPTMTHGTWVGFDATGVPHGAGLPDDGNYTVGLKQEGDTWSVGFAPAAGADRGGHPLSELSWRSLQALDRALHAHIATQGDSAQPLLLSAVTAVRAALDTYR